MRKARQKRQKRQKRNGMKNKANGLKDFDIMIIFINSIG